MRLTFAVLAAALCATACDFDRAYHAFCSAEPNRCFTITSVAIPGAGASLQVRQGGTATLTVNGTHLDDIESASIEGVTVALQAGKTAARLTLELTVPHGAELVSKELVLSAKDGEARFPNALVITPIVSSASSGDDARRGTPDSPFKSVTQALSVAGSGDQVQLLAGTYDEATTGEDWPQQAGDPLPATVPWNVPAGVTLQGATSGITTISTQSTDPVIALSLQGGASVSYVTLNNFSRGVVVAGGAVQLDHVSIRRSSKEGLLVLGGSVDVTHSGLTTNFRHGIVLQGGALRLSDVSSTQNATSVSGYGLVVRGGSVMARTTTLSNNSVGLYVEGEPTTVDFGTMADKGDNLLTSNSEVQIWDARTVDGQVPLEFSFTTVQGGGTPEPTHTVVGPVDDPLWRIAAMNELRFYYGR